MVYPLPILHSDISFVYYSLLWFTQNLFTTVFDLYTNNTKTGKEPGSSVSTTINWSERE